LQLLWEEYQKGCEQAYCYTSFRIKYRAWVATLRRSMRKVHIAGERLFVDFVGQTVPLIDAATSSGPRIVALRQDQVAIVMGLKAAMPSIFGKECTKNYLALISDAFLLLAANRRAFWKLCNKHGLTKDNSGITTHAFRKEFAVQEMKRRGLAVMKFPNTPEYEDSIDSAVENRQLFELESPLTLQEERKRPNITALTSGCDLN
jgi:hypothetical protein